MKVLSRFALAAAVIMNTVTGAADSKIAETDPVLNSILACEAKISEITESIEGLESVRGYGKAVAVAGTLSTTTAVGLNLFAAAPIMIMDIIYGSLAAGTVLGIGGASTRVFYGKDRLEVHYGARTTVELVRKMALDLLDGKPGSAIQEYKAACVAELSDERCDEIVNSIEQDLFAGTLCTGSGFSLEDL